jgi:hypothetical protein
MVVERLTRRAGWALVVAVGGELFGARAYCGGFGGVLRCLGALNRCFRAGQLGVHFNLISRLSAAGKRQCRHENYCGERHAVIRHLETPSIGRDIRLEHQG